MASRESRFAQHEQAFDDAVRGLSKAVSDAKFAGGDERTEMIRTANRKADEAAQALRHMEGEMANMGPNKRRSASEKISQSKADLASQKKALDQLVASASRAGAGGSAGMSREEREQRQKLLGIEHSSASATSHLQFARATLAETEETGVSTLSEMESQGRQLRRIQGNVHEVNSLADMGRGILNNMEVTAMKNQLLLWLAILVLLGCVGAVVYFGYIKSPK